MFDALLQWISPPPGADGDADYYDVKNRRLLAAYMVVVSCTILFFVFLDYLGGKMLSSSINLICWLILVGVVLFYRRTGAFLPAVILVVGSAQVLLGVQHLYAPDGLVANLFWPPLLTMMSVHLLGRRAGLQLGLGSSAIVVIAAILRPFLDLQGDAFSDSEIFRFHIISLTLTIAVGLYIAGQLSAEIDQVIRRIEGQKSEFFELYETNSALLSMVGHDLNNHLTSLNLLAGATAASLTEPVPVELRQLEERLVAVGKLVGQTSAISAVRSGKLLIQPTTVELRAALDESINLFETLLAERNIAVQKDIPNGGRPILVVAEPYSLVTNVLSNALSNAIKFSPNDSRIEISVEEHDAAVLLHVADRGVGIPPDLLPHVFDFNTPTAREGVRGEKGTGFGLPILKMFMERYDATVEVASANPGTTLSMRFKRPQP